MAKTPQPCGCGCGGMTKGGRFLPGHDARFHAAQKKGRLGAAVAHATGAHGTATGAPERSSGYQRPDGKEEPDEARPVTEATDDNLIPPKGSGKGTTVAPGMWVRATISKEPHEGIVYSVDPFGNVTFVDDQGKQWIGYPGMTWVLDTNTKRKPNSAQRNRLVAIGRTVPAMFHD